MKYEILLNSIFRASMGKGINLLEDYQKNVSFKNFAEQQRILDVLTDKKNVINQFKEEAFDNMFLTLAFMIKGKNEYSDTLFESVKNYPMIIWLECLGTIESNDIMSLLNNYAKELPSIIIETCIINLSEDLQIIAIEKYNSYLEPNSKMFSNFYYAVSDKARIILKKFYPNEIEEDILLELEDLFEDELIVKLEVDKDKINKLPTDNLIKFILLKAINTETLNTFFKLYPEKIKECSLSMFKLLFTRYKYLNNKKDLEEGILTDKDIFILFKDKFHLIGLEETLSLFDNKVTYNSNDFTVYIILKLLDIAYYDVNLSKYINDRTIIEAINKFVERCSNKNYTFDDFANLVSKIDGKTKLIHDDYIEAIIACGKLLKNNIINDKNLLFLELRNKFTCDLLTRCSKDGTYLEDITLNGLFYRLLIGSMSFVDVYMTKTYKGLIYLTKVSESLDKADYITKFLTDEQIAKLNISPVIRWKNTIIRKNISADNLAFIERMGIQLLCYFGINKAKYLLESNMYGNRMESLFDGLKYDNISIKEDGTSSINQELINYLFGNGMMKEPNSVINRMIRGDIPEFEKYFTEFCNSFEEIKKSCNGILSVKRIIKCFDNFKLPINLKPDEIEFELALKEMNTMDSELLKEAISLCKDARSRKYSTIPQVEGKIGKFTYKILKLDDPLAVAVGYLSHCCFKVKGISYSALKHSMQSKNGRTFVVYYQGKFLTQSWVWRNGDVICFDSVEAGSPQHGMYNDGIKLVDVYKQAANEMLNISMLEEDEIQRVKVVTVGKSDYRFENLQNIDIDPPRPLEKNIYVYDSAVQQILAGDMPKEPRYGEVAMEYKDKRKKVITINNISNVNIDTLDEVILRVNSLRYQIYGEEISIDYNNYTKIILGHDWYILININEIVETGILNNDKEILEEFNKYMSKYKLEYSKKLALLKR